MGVQSKFSTTPGLREGIGDVVIKQDAPSGIGTGDELHLICEGRLQTLFGEKCFVEIKVARFNGFVNDGRECEGGEVTVIQIVYFA